MAVPGDSCRCCRDDSNIQVRYGDEVADEGGKGKTMRSLTRALLWTLLLTAGPVASGGVAQAAEPDASSVTSAAIAAEVEQWYRDAFERSGAGGPAAFVDSASAAYGPPLRYLELDKEIMLGDTEAVRTFIQGYSDWLASAPGSTATLERIQVRALNGTAATLVADWKILAADGKPMTDATPVQYFYVVSRGAEGWRVVSEATVMSSTKVEFK